MSVAEPSIKRPFVIAVTLHLVVFVLLFWRFAPSNDFAKRSLQPDVEIIKAVAVSQQSLDKMHETKLEKQKAEEKRIAELKRRKLEEEIAAKKTAEKKAAREKAAAQKIAEEKAAKEKAAKEAELTRQHEAAKKAAEAKAVAEKAAQEKVAAEKADKLAAQQKAAKELQEAQDKALQESIAQEQKAMEAAKSKASQTEIDRYLALIQLALENNWNKPPEIDPSMYVLLNVQVGPGGVVLNVSIAKSSGNSALDNSARAAVFKASPLPVPSDPDLFNSFRVINLQAGGEKTGY